MTSYDRLGDSDEPWTCPKCHSNSNSAKLYMIPSDAGNPSLHPLQNTYAQQMSSNPPYISSPGLSSTTDTEHHSLQSLGSSGISLDLENGMTSSPKAQRNPGAKQGEKRRHLRILNINCQSVKKKGRDLEALIDSTDPDIILGTESWLNEHISSAEFLPSFLGFDIHRRDRSDSHGGVFIAAKRELGMHDIQRPKDIEMISGTVKLLKQKKLSVAAHYRPPKRFDNPYLASTKEEFDKLKRRTKHNVLIIGGDFNSPDIDWPTLSIQGNQYPLRLSKTILDLVNDNDLEQIVDFPTRKDKTLDLIMTTHPSFKSRCKPLLSLGNSDHDIVLYDTSLTPP